MVGGGGAPDGSEDAVVKTNCHIDDGDLSSSSDKEICQL